MQRHLLPNEIDLLLDGESGFGVAPLQAHVAGCDACRARLDDARQVVLALDGLGRHAPRPDFAGRVMAQMQIVQPLHVAVADAAQALVPASSAGRLAAAALAAAAGLSLSVLSVWVALRADLALYAGHLLADRARAGLLRLVAETVQGTLGDSAITALRVGGPAALAVGAATLALGVALATAGFRRLAAVARPSRS